METDKPNLVQPGVKPAPEQFLIKIMDNGPYLVYGEPKIVQEFLVLNEDGYPWTYRQGAVFEADGCVALCRCGQSNAKPFCDCTHLDIEWDSRETASREPVLDGAVILEGAGLSLADNEPLCALARFCDSYGRIWNLLAETDDAEKRAIVEHEANHCPSGRLIIIDKATGQPVEPDFEPSIGLLEDPDKGVSGPVWVKGGIRILSSDGTQYEIRNRVTLCRCGLSSNKPFCDCEHVTSGWQDGLPTA